MMRSRLIRFARAFYDAMPRPVRVGMVRSAMKLASRSHRVATVDGLTFDLDLGEVIDFNLYIGQYEPEVAAAMERWTPPGATVVDIGANIGAHALHLAKLVGPKGRVIAIEPTDFAFAKLQRNLALNPGLNVEPIKAALSDEPLAAQRVDFRASWRTDGSRNDAYSTVDFVRLDDALASRNVTRVDLMKIDIDGNEYPMMLGGLETIRRDRPVLLMEAVGPHFDDDARNPFRILAELGYQFRDLKTGEALTLAQMRDRLPRNDTGITISFNVVASTKF